MVATINEFVLFGESSGPQSTQVASSEQIKMTQGKLPKKTEAGLTYSDIRELRKQPTIALTRELMPGPILAANWSVEGRQEKALNVSPEDLKLRVEFIKENLMRVRDTLLTVSIRGLLDFGWQPFEKVFEVDEQGFTYLKKMKPLLQDYTQVLVEEHGDFIGLIQVQKGPNMTDLTLDVSKSFVLSTDVEGTNYYGESRFSFAKGAIDDWNDANDGANRYDRKIAGSHWVVHYPVGVTKVDNVEQDNYLIAQDMLNKLESSGSIIVPNALNKFVSDMADESKGWVIDTLSDISARQYSFTNRLEYLDKCMVRSMGFPERAILEGRFGTKAESGTHANIAAASQDVRHRYIVNEINENIVDQLLRINYGPDAAGTVRLKPAPITDANLSFLQDAYMVMLNNKEVAHAERNGLDMAELRDKVALPNREGVDQEDIGEEEEVVVDTFAKDDDDKGSEPNPFAKTDDDDADDKGEGEA